MSMGIKWSQSKLLVNFSLDQMVPEGHLLRRVGEIDLAFIRKWVRELYSHTGQPSVDPVVIFKMWLLGYMYGVTSERKLCEEASMHMAWRWFLGYELDEKIPDHSVLSRARLRYGPEVFEQFLAQSVQLCQEHGLVEGRTVFVDATHTIADASPFGMQSRSLLEQIEGLPPVRTWTEDVWESNQSDDDEDQPRPKKPRGTKPGDETAQYRKKRKSKSTTNAMLMSPVDPDAQTFCKPGKTPILAHKTHFAVDGGAGAIITAVLVRPACEIDSAVVTTILAKHERAVGSMPEEFVADKGYTSKAAYRACRKRGVTPVIPLKETANSQGGKHRDSFTYIAERDVFICPSGHELKEFSLHRVDRTTSYKPQAGTCSQCEIKKMCTPAKGDRQVVRSWDAEMMGEVAAHLRTPRARWLMRQRSVKSERTNAWAKENHGFRRAQRRGRGNMWIQAAMTAATINLKRMVTWKPKPQTGVAASGLASFCLCSAPAF